MAEENKNKPRIKAEAGVRKASKLPTPKRGIGTAGIAFYQQIVEQIQPYELRWPQSVKTFEAMKNDDAIATVLKLTYNLIESAFANQKITYNKSSPESEQAAEFLQYCLDHLDSNTWMQVIRNIETFKQNGFSIVEKIYNRIPADNQWYGDYEYRISDLCNRPQMSLDESTPFEVGSGGRRIKAVRQKDNFFQNKFSNNLFVAPDDITGKGYKRIQRKKLMLFGENATDSTPFGNPVLRYCYKSWKEKLFLEDLEINGASKDLAGIIELAIPSEILNKAAADPTSEESQMVESMINQAANIHSGMQSSIIRPSDLQEGSSSVTDYSTRLLGIEGGGKSFEVSDMIQKRRKAIFDVWGAGHTLTGEGSVSYNSAEVKNAIHMHYIKADIKVIEDVLNKDLIPQLFNVMNDKNLSYKDLPKIVAGDIDKISYDEAGKLIQRVKSVNGLVLSKHNIIRMHEMMGFDVDHMEALSLPELIEMMESSDKGQSRAGESKGSSGTGETQKGGSNSTINSENSA